MGYNTVVFMLNDMMDNIAKNPKTVVWLLSHPVKLCEDDQSRWDDLRRSLAREYGEPGLHSQAMEMLPTFHADQTKYLRAGGNSIEEMKFVGYEKREGKRVVVLEVPEWLAKQMDQREKK